MIKIILAAMLFVFGGNFNFKTQLDNYLNRSLKQYDHFTYKIVSIPQFVKYNKNLHLIINQDSKLNISRGYAYIHVKITDSKGNSTNSVITIKLKIFNKVYQTTHNIQRGSPLKISDFRSVTKNITQFRSPPITNIKGFENFAAKRYIAENSVLLKNMVDIPPVINFGDVVNAIYINGSVEVSFKATARDAGRIGDTIRVIRNDKQIFKAKIINKNNVLING